MLLKTGNKRGGDLNSFQDIWALPVSRGDRTTMYGLDLHTIRCYLTQKTRIYDLGVWISTVFKLFGHFLFKGRCYHPLWS
jgi:hypothetical protein